MKFEVKVTKIKCERCGFVWQPRSEDVRICPKCKSARFDTPKENLTGDNERKVKHENK
jgi:predicted Zn-ribbon and HTH transcriptional regulator